MLLQKKKSTVYFMVDCAVTEKKEHCISDRQTAPKMDTKQQVIYFAPLFIIASTSLTELLLAAATAGWWFAFCVSTLLVLLFLQTYIAERDSEAALLLQVADSQNLALGDSLRLADLLRSIAVKQRKTSASVENARAGLRRSSKSAGELEMRAMQNE